MLEQSAAGVSLQEDHATTKTPWEWFSLEAASIHRSTNSLRGWPHTNDRTDFTGCCEDVSERIRLFVLWHNLLFPIAKSTCIVNFNVGSPYGWMICSQCFYCKTCPRKRHETCHASRTLMEYHRQQTTIFKSWTSSLSPTPCWWLSTGLQILPSLFLTQHAALLRWDLQ